jgi:hypothetical protein
MASDDWQRFHALVLADRELQDRLRAERDWPRFVELALALGAQRGCHFTADDVAAALSAGRRSWIERWI